MLATAVQVALAAQVAPELVAQVLLALAAAVAAVKATDNAQLDLLAAAAVLAFLGKALTEQPGLEVPVLVMVAAVALVGLRV
jgi:hypothetical protein